MIGRLAYALLFAVMLPVLLVAWAARMDALLSLPVYGSPAIGWPLVAAGVVLMAWATRDLWVLGGGMPASPYPPTRFVTRGVYGVVAHPIYVGALLAAAGASLATRSAAGLWIVTPTLAIAMAAWIVGFEAASTRAHFGDMPAPLLSLPPDTDERRAPRDIASFYLLVLLPWFLAYEAVELLGVPPDARTMFVAWDTALPVIPWTEVLYFASYPAVLLAPVVAPTRRAVRALSLDGQWATALIVPLYLLLPFVAQAKPVVGEGAWDWLLRFERVGDAPVTAFPAFHIVWTAIAAGVFARRWPAARRLAVLFVAAVAVSCVTTGMHAAADVVAGLAAYAIVAKRAWIWNTLRLGAEKIANSWGEAQIGPVRLINHGIYAGLGVAVGVGVAVTLAGPEYTWWLTSMTALAILGAGIWAQLVEGSPQLLRPYGYFGSVVAALLFALGAGAAGADGWLLLCSFGIGTTVGQSLGRMRCLVQGCCHGRQAPLDVGIRYTRPRSRVVRLAGLGDVPLYPTQLYSALWMLFVGAVLLRLWWIAAPLSFIAGTYFLLTGAGRFVEEHFRGEPQTAVFGGLRLYQWLAIVFVVLGPVLMSFASRTAPPPHAFAPRSLPLLLVIAVVAYAAYGLDFPASHRRFSRLT